MRVPRTAKHHGVAMTGRRPAITVLAQCLPYPPQSGVRTRTFNVLRELQKEFDITLVPFSRRVHQPRPADRHMGQAMLQRHLTRVATPIPIPSEQSRARWVWDHLRSVLTNQPYIYYEYRSRDFRQELGRLHRANVPRLVHLDSIDLMGWCEDLPRVPVACTHHDIEPLLLRLRAARMSGMAGAYVRYQADLVEQLMRRACPGFDLNVVMSDMDAARLAHIAPASRIHIAPNGVDTEYFRPMPEVATAPGDIVFLGPTYQFANRDAVEYLIYDIFPRVRTRSETASVTLVGRNDPADRDRWQRVPSVCCAGEVTDVRPLLAAGACFVVPIRVGGGTRLKILDAWAMGKAVVSTSAGCEGLHAIDGENILIRDDPQALADAVLAVLDDPALRRRLGNAARETVCNSYAWPRIGERLRAAYWSLLDR